MKRVVITVVIGLVVCLAALHAQTPATADPNSPVDPNAIKLPEGAKLPMQLKCPVHGLIGKDFIAMEFNGKTNIYCSQCAKSFICRVFDLNLPKLEVVK